MFPETLEPIPCTEEISSEDSRSVERVYPEGLETCGEGDGKRDLDGKEVRYRNREVLSGTGVTSGTTTP